METVGAALAALESTAVAEYLRVSRWGYAAVSTAHIFGIALLVGAILPLHLRIFGLWRRVSRTALVRVLVPVAASGLALAAGAGLLLFSIRAREYADIGLMQAKFALVGLGALSALALHATHGLLLEKAGRTRLKTHAAISLTCWIGALICGRLIAFAGE